MLQKVKDGFSVVQSYFNSSPDYKGLYIPCGFVFVVSCVLLGIGIRGIIQGPEDLTYMEVFVFSMVGGLGVGTSLTGLIIISVLEEAEKAFKMCREALKGCRASEESHRRTLKGWLATLDKWEDCNKKFKESNSTNFNRN